MRYYVSIEREWLDIEIEDADSKEDAIAQAKGCIRGSLTPDYEHTEAYEATD